MHSTRRTAATTGVLFITATLANVVGSGLSKSLTTGPDYFDRLLAHANQVTAGTILEVVAAGACAGIAISLYPVLEKVNGGLALGSVVFRTLEAVMYLIAAGALLSLLPVSQRFVEAGTADRPALQAVGDSLLSFREQVTLLGVLAFSLGALMYYAVFYQSRLIPRLLSGWGIVGVVLAIIACLIAMFSRNPLLTYTPFMLPIAVQEMVLALWLIARGFTSSAVQSGTRSTIVHTAAAA